MLPAEERLGHDATGPKRLDLPGIRRVSIQRERRAGLVVVAEVPGQNAPQEVLAEHDHVVQALAPDPTPVRLRVSSLAFGGAMYRMVRIPFARTGVLGDGKDVVFEPLGVALAVTSHFLHNWILRHHSSPCLMTPLLSPGPMEDQGGSAAPSFFAHRLMI